MEEEYLVDQGKFSPEGICNSGCSLGSAGIGAHDDALFEIWDVLLDVLFEQWAPVEVVDGDIEEALVLGIMQIHGDDMICTGTGQEICDQSSSLCYPFFVPGTGFEATFVAIRNH